MRRKGKELKRRREVRSISIIFKVLRLVIIILCSLLIYSLFMRYQSSISDVMFKGN